MRSSPLEGTDSITESLDRKTSALFTLLAAANGQTAERYAESILKSHSEESLGSDEMMASIGRALISNRQTPRAEKKPAPQAPSAPKKAEKSRNKPDGLPKGYSRTKNGDVITNEELRKITLCSDDVAKLLNTSSATITRAVTEKAVVPYGHIGSARFPRFRELEVDQIDNWLKTPCSKGPAPRNVRCSVCNRYFSKQGIRIHELHCEGGRGDKTEMAQR